MQANFSSYVPQVEDDLLRAFKRYHASFEDINSSDPAFDGTAFPSLTLASRTASTYATVLQTPRWARGVNMRLRWTTTDATQTLAMNLLGGTNTAAPADYSFASSGILAVTSTGELNTFCYPGIEVVNRLQQRAQNTALPRYFSPVVFLGNANPITFELSYQWIR